MERILNNQEVDAFFAETGLVEIRRSLYDVTVKITKI